MSLRFWTSIVATLALVVAAPEVVQSAPAVSGACASHGTTTNGTPTSRGGVVEGAIPSTNTTKTTNATQNGSPIEPNVSNPTNVSELPCAEGVPSGGTTAPVRMSRARSRNMLTHNPNGRNWLAKYDRGARVSSTGNPPY